jgi:hypothetical protein
MPLSLKISRNAPGVHRHRILSETRLCCTKRVRDSCRESNVVAGPHEQTDIADLQNQELG